MDRINQYMGYIEEIIYQYATHKPAYGDIELQPIIDKKNNHYQLIYLGWNNDERVRGCLIHVNIKNNKIWIQHDGTEESIVNLLLEKGLTKKDIVLAFHAPFKRKYTDFAEK